MSMRAVARRARPVFLAAILLLASAESGWATVVFPESQFYEYTSGLGQIEEGDQTLPEAISLAYDIPELRSVVGSATTIGGALPRGEMHLTLTSYVDPFNPINGQALAAIRYYWAVEQVGGDPFDGKVPVDIETHGRVTSTVETTSGGIGNLFAEAFFETINDSDYSYQANACAGLQCETGEFLMDEQFTVEATPDAENRVDLTVGGDGTLYDIGFFSIEGFVDPHIEISPSFARREDFRLVFSNHVVPEPDTELLFAAAVAAIASARALLQPR
jgi:hypothetical protein